MDTVTASDDLHPALRYAEYLGVNSVHAEAEALLLELDDSMSTMDKKLDLHRSLEAQIEDREMEILIAERGKAPDISQAAMDRRLKEARHQDEQLRKLRTQRDAAAGEAAGHKLDIEYIKYSIKVKVARMEELGGYFQFLAATKNAETNPPRYAEAGVSTPMGEASGGETTTHQENK